MKWVILVLILSGCASNSDGYNIWTGYANATDEQKVMVLVKRYGARCGAPSDPNAQISEAESNRLAECIRASALADKQPTFSQNLGYGLRGAGEIMGAPTPRADLMCLSDCQKRYSWAYCQSFCSY